MVHLRWAKLTKKLMLHALAIEDAKFQKARFSMRGDQDWMDVNT
jgi:hypothetical protein